jgi:signal transduction histidine kinase
MAANDVGGRKLQQPPKSERTTAAGPLISRETADNGRDDALRRAVRLEVVQELADEMAHDLNNALTVIAGSLQLFLMQQGGETAQHHFVRNAIEAALRGAQMTGNLLAYASPQIVDAHDFDLDALIQSLASLLQETLGPAVTLKLRSVGTNPRHFVRADPRFVESALLALGQQASTSNTGDHTKGSGGAVTISYGRLAGGAAQERSGAVAAGLEFVVLEIRFEATGLQPQFVRRALTPAFSTTELDRTSLDLSAAYASIRMSGGDIGIITGPETGPETGVRESLKLSAQPFTVSILLPSA